MDDWASNEQGALATLFRTARAEKRLRQKQVAQDAGISQSRLSRIEAGHYDPRLSELVRLARVLDIPAERISAFWNAVLKT